MKHGWLTVELPNEATRGGPHKARVAVATSNTRCCSDGFEVNYDDCDELLVTIVLDCRDSVVMSRETSSTAYRSNDA